MKKNCSRFIILIVSIVLLCSNISSAAGKNSYPEYINLDGFHPILNEGENVTIKVGVAKSNYPAAGDAKDLWLFHYLKERMNLQFEFISIGESSWLEQKNLLFASGVDFDVSYGLSLSTDDVMLYGAQEGQLLALNDYITPELTPNMYKLFSENPTVLGYITAADGNIYTLPCVNPPTYASVNASYINDKAVRESGLNIPTTLDELIDFARAWKEKYPDSIPIGGGYDTNSPIILILSALGVVTQANVDATSDIEVSPCVYNGEAIIPAANEEVYTAYITAMNTLYTEGLISPDFFTIDRNADAAQVAEGKTVVINGIMPYIHGASDSFDDWEAMRPLTSAMNDTPQWDGYANYRIGNVWLSKNCTCPELIMRWFDWYYTLEGALYMWMGPYQESEDTLGIVSGWYVDDTGADRSASVDDGTYASIFDYLVGAVSPGTMVGNYGLIFEAKYGVIGKQFTSIEDTYSPSDGDPNAKISMNKNLRPYIVDGFPPFVYMNAEIASKANEYKTLLKSYVMNQSALFITGQRPLSEIGAFIEEVNGMGMQEYQAIFQNVYKNYLSTLN